MSTLFIRFSLWARRALASNSFFNSMVVFFTIGAVYVALTSLYPMAFDEDFHFGLIKIYAQHVLPFGIKTTSDMAVYGSATHDPSYLFHYLLSFPYRIMHSFGMAPTSIILVLRLINVACVVGALYVYRTLLLSMNFSKTITNLAVTGFMLIPILPVLAGQINYDNLLLLEIGVAALLVVRISHTIRTKQTIPLHKVGYFAVVSLIASATKYTFLPILLGMILYLFTVLILKFHRNFSALYSAFIISLQQMRKYHTTLIIIGIVWGCVLNIKYVTNELHNRSLTPSCDQIFTQTDCLSYGPYARDVAYKQNIPSNFSAVSYPEYLLEYWVPGMVYRLFFAVAGPTNNFVTKNPLPVPILAFVTFLALGISAILYRLRSITRKSAWWLFIAISGVYTFVLSVTLYRSYVETANPVAINGRYLLPLLPLFFGCMLAAIQTLPLKKISQLLPGIILMLIVFIIIEGGGATSYVVQSETSWFYTGPSQSSHVFLKKILGPLTLSID